MASTVASPTRKKAKLQARLSPTAIVAEYAAAKSRQDIDGALRVCREDFVLDTVPFGIRGTGKAEVAAHLCIFFTTFPDYGTTLDGQATGEDVVTAWGTIRATMRGRLGSFAPTGRAFALPFSCVFPLRDGLLAAEHFFFDLNAMCEQLGLPVERVAAELRAFRSEERSEAPEDAAGAFVAKFREFWRPPVDPERLGTVLHDDGRLESPGLPATVGLDAGKEAFRNLFALMPDFRAESERWSAAGDALFLELTLRANVGGQEVRVPAVDRFLLRDGKAVERVSFFDPRPFLEALRVAAPQ